MDPVERRALPGDLLFEGAELLDRAGKVIVPEFGEAREDVVVRHTGKPALDVRELGREVGVQSMQGVPIATAGAGSKQLGKGLDDRAGVLTAASALLEPQDVETAVEDPPIEGELVLQVVHLVPHVTEFLERMAFERVEVLGVEDDIDPAAHHGDQQFLESVGYGFTQLETQMPKCRWGRPPLAFPVSPLYPTMSPLSTRAPVWIPGPSAERWA